MGFFDLIFGHSQRYPHVTVYAENIERIPALRFKREIKVLINGEKQIIKEQKIKDLLKKEVKGGKSLNLLDEKLRKIGLKSEQWEKRKWLMDIVAAAVKTASPEADGYQKEADPGREDNAAQSRDNDYEIKFD